MSVLVDPNGNAGSVVATTNGQDSINGQGGDDFISGAGGADFIKGGPGNDDIAGGGGDDTLSGAAGDDSINGGNGNDKISGGEGKDFLVGGLGDDIISGGAGDNRMAGGSGSDTFVFTAESTGKDKILDFELGIDIVKLNGVSVTSVEAFGTGSIAYLDTGGSIIFKGVDVSDLGDLFFG
ncbi:MAG: calcium-binding protein [Jannaschia sp.]